MAVVEFFVKFDKSIMETVRSKDIGYCDKILEFFDTYATYYGNYKEISAVILHYEELLHNSGTREMISQCIVERSEFLTNLIRGGMDAGEIQKDIYAKEMADMMINIMNGMILDRRVMVVEMSLKQELNQTIEQILRWISLR